MNVNVNTQYEIGQEVSFYYADLIHTGIIKNVRLIIGDSKIKVSYHIVSDDSGIDIKWIEEDGIVD